MRWLLLSWSNRYNPLCEMVVAALKNCCSVAQTPPLGDGCCCPEEAEQPPLWDGGCLESTGTTPSTRWLLLFQINRYNPLYEMVVIVSNQQVQPPLWDGCCPEEQIQPPLWDGCCRPGELLFCSTNTTSVRWLLLSWRGRTTPLYQVVVVILKNWNAAEYCPEEPLWVLSWGTTIL